MNFFSRYVELRAEGDTRLGHVDRYEDRQIPIARCVLFTFMLEAPYQGVETHEGVRDIGVEAFAIPAVLVQKVCTLITPQCRVSTVSVSIHSIRLTCIVITVFCNH